MVPTLTMLGRFSECTRDEIAVPEVPTTLVTSASMTLCSCRTLPGAQIPCFASFPALFVSAVGKRLVIVGPSARGSVIGGFCCRRVPRGLPERRRRAGIVVAPGPGSFDRGAGTGARPGRLGHGPDHGRRREAVPDRCFRGGDEDESSHRR